MDNAKPTVFVVDDDAAVRSAVSLLIRSRGWAVQAFESAEAFLNSYAPSRKDCLVLDLQMPGMNGADLLRTLADRELSIPTIVITGHSEDPLTTSAKRAGVLAVISKPFRRAELLPILQRALDNGSGP